MKNIIQFLILIIIMSSCKSAISMNESKESFVGSYKLKNGNKLYMALSETNYDKLVLNKDKTFILYHASIHFSPAIEQCDYASKGQWETVDDNIIDLTSENFFLKQEGFKYDLRQENKLSNDSIYLNLNFPSDFHPVKITYTFNDNKVFKTNKLNIALLKSQYLKSSSSINVISLRLDSEISGTEIYNGRIMFDVFTEKIDTSKSNYFSINLPYFDQCFVDFEPYNHSLIYRQNKNILFWKGLEWIRE